MLQHMQCAVQSGEHTGWFRVGSRPGQQPRCHHACGHALAQSKNVERHPYRAGRTLQWLHSPLSSCLSYSQYRHRAWIYSPAQTWPCLLVVSGHCDTGGARGRRQRSLNFALRSKARTRPGAIPLRSESLPCQHTRAHTRAACTTASRAFHVQYLCSGSAAHCTAHRGCPRRPHSFAVGDAAGISLFAVSLSCCLSQASMQCIVHHRSSRFLAPLATSLSPRSSSWRATS